MITNPDAPPKNFGIGAKADRVDRQLGDATSGPVADWREAYHDRLSDQPA